MTERKEEGEPKTLAEYLADARSRGRILDRSLVKLLRGVRRNNIISQEAMSLLQAEQLDHGQRERLFHLLADGQSRKLRRRL